MAKQEQLNFKEISEQISFEDVFNWLNIPFENTGKELKGKGFIVSIEKNLYLNSKDKTQSGSVINFLSILQKIELREAASKLKAEFLSQKEVKTIKDIPILKLEYHSYLTERGISREVAEEYEVGYVQQRSIMSGRITFKVYGHDKEHLGYVGYKVEKDNWYFPTGFKRPLYNLNRIEDKDFVIVTTDPFDALKFISLEIREVVCLLGNSMTSEQENELKKFKRVLLFHNNPANILSRLCKECFVKVVDSLKPIKDIFDQ